MKQKIILPRGYQIKTYTEEYSTEEAYSLLRSRSHRRFGSAVKLVDRAVLTRHTIRCPWCGREEPAYADQRKHSAQDLAVWADLQLSLFDSHNCRNFRNPVYPNIHLCGSCQNASSHHEGNMTAQLEELEGKITLSLPVERFSELMEIPWLPRLQLPGSFPLEETLEFDLEKGAVQLLLKKGELLLCKKAVSIRTKTDDSRLLALAEQYRPVRRALRRSFEKHWQLPFPLSTRELTLKQFVLLTQFVGFPKSFYMAIPFDRATQLPDESFSELIPTLHSWDEMPALLESSRLPSVPSLRKRFGQEPGLLFYLPECEQLWDILADINLLCGVLQTSEVYRLLSQLHCYPGLLTMYRDFVTVKGRTALCSMIQQKLTALHSTALMYCALSTIGRKREQKRWRDKKWYKSFPTLIPEPDFSIPMQLPPAHIPDRSLMGYQFRWLRTSQDYRLAGDTLGNCLSDWRSDQPPVTIVCKGGNYLAALEVSNGRITQAYKEGNKLIEPDSPLSRAIKRWCSLYHLTW